MRRGCAGPTVLIMAGCVVFGAREARAQGGLFNGMQAGVESVFSSATTTVTFVSGTVTRTKSTNVYPMITLNMNTLLYPSLRLNTGGVFEVNSLTTRGSQSTIRSTTTRNRPFFLLRSTNPVLSPGIGYFRREAVDRTSGSTGVKLVNDEYSAYLGWKPEGGPRSDLQFVNTHTFDGERATQDVRKNFGSLVSGYLYKSLGLYYRGSYLDTDNHIERLRTRQLSQGVRADYGQSFLRKRLVWNAAYNLNHQIIKTRASGTAGEVSIPVTPFAGLAALSDTPTTVALSPNGPLIDGNLTASAGVNLGLPASPANAQLRNLGLDLLTPTEVNRLFVWVDRELPVEITSTFSWEIYSSRDNITWTRESIATMAPFGAFENRFEVDFASVTARYIKVVTAPLSAVAPNATQFPDILVTELQAYVRRPAAEIGSRVTQSRYLFNTDVRMRLIDAPALYYESIYLANGTNGLGVTTDTWSNGFSMNHSFARVFSTYARLAREQGRQVQGDRAAVISNATLTVEPIPTFRTSILYSGQNERVAGMPARRHGVYVQNAARPYRGIDLLFGVGWTATRQYTGEVSRDRLANVSATIVPREHVSLTLNYEARATHRPTAPIGSPRIGEHRTYAAVAVDPIPSLHLVLGSEVIAIAGQKTRTTLNTNVSWAAFPNGALQFIFAYNEALRALEFGKDRSSVAAIRWNVSRKSFIDVSYQRTRNATAFLRTETRMLSTRVRLFL